MGRKSIRENKNVYQHSRESAELTRAQACERMQCVSESRLYRIESGETLPYPDEVSAMSEAYKAPGLCNFYCANDCPLGQDRVAVVPEKELPIITLEILSILNKLSTEKDRLIEISADGRISQDEMLDFKRIRERLEEMSSTIDALQLWLDNAIAAGGLDDGSRP